MERERRGETGPSCVVRVRVVWCMMYGVFSMYPDTLTMVSPSLFPPLSLPPAPDTPVATIQHVRDGEDGAKAVTRRQVE